MNIVRVHIYIKLLNDSV